MIRGAGKPRYDLEKAKALMAEAGYADGFSITMMCAQQPLCERRQDLLRPSASMLSKINIKVDLHHHAQGAILAQVRRTRG